MEKAKRLREMQKLAKQQQDLMELMNKTEEVISAIEIEGEISLASLRNLQSNVDNWVKGLETEEEHRKRKAEEAAEEDRKRKRKEEDEKRKKEEEEKRKAEEEKRKAEEERMRDPNNWPTYE